MCKILHNLLFEYISTINKLISFDESHERPESIGVNIDDVTQRKIHRLIIDYLWFAERMRPKMQRSFAHKAFLF